MRTALAIAGGLAAAIVWLALGSYCAFVPWSREPPYRFVHAWGGKGTAPSELREPTGIAVVGDEVFVSDARNGRIQVSAPDGTLLGAIDPPGDGPGGLDSPGAVAFGPERPLFVSGFYDHRVQKFAPDGTFLTSFAGEGSGPAPSTTRWPWRWRGRGRSSPRISSTTT